MEFRLLGAVEVHSGEGRIDAGPPKSRLLLAILLLARQDAVAPESLARHLWDDDAPPRYLASLQAYASRLRRSFSEFGEDLVSLPFISGVGYRLRVPSENVDALRFSALTQRGRKAAADGDRHGALELLNEARSLVRGEPLADLAGSWAQSARAELQEKLLESALIRIRLQLDQGDPESVIGELRQLAVRYQYDESIAGLLMRALHEAGRSADALAHYRLIDRRLRKDLGIEPHARLVAVNQMILTGRLDIGPSVPAGPAGLAASVPRNALSRKWDEAPTPNSRIEGDDNADGAVAAMAMTAVAPAPNTLERDLPGFTGRAFELNTLSSQIAQRLADGQPAVCVISGMPGVGKSSLALRLAYLLRPMCPDGALQLHLRGHDANRPPNRPETALVTLLSTFGLDPQRLQQAGGLDHLVSLWRGHGDGRRILVLLDDAADAEQLRPLIPNSPGSIVLITSRSLLLDLPDAINHPLEPMAEEDASALFIRSAQLPADTDPAEVAAAVATCGGVPLALSMAGGLLRGRPKWTATDLAEHLRNTERSAVGNALTQCLAATFDTSYRLLPVEARVVLRHLALYPGRHIDAGFAAALAGLSAEETYQALCTLYEHNLLTEPQRKSYGLHDLLRGFAARIMATEASVADFERARDRLLRYSLVASDRASALFDPHRHTPLPALRRDAAWHRPLPAPAFADAHAAAEWLDTHQETLRIVMDESIRRRKPEAALMAHQLAAYSDRRGLWAEAAVLHECALATWADLGDKAGQARARNDLATAHWRLGRLDRARREAESALDLWRALGDEDGQAEANLNLGRILHVGHWADEAAQRFRQAAFAWARLGDRRGEAEGLYRLGLALFQAGRHGEAIIQCERALDVAKSVHDEAIECNCVNNLGTFHQRRGEFELALKYYRRAYELSLPLGDPNSHAIILLNLGEAYNLTGSPAEAGPMLDSAAAIFQRLGNGIGVANVLFEGIRSGILLGRLDDAERFYRQAVDECGKIPDPVFAVRLRLMEAALAEQHGDREAALAAYEAALSSADGISASTERAEAHRGIGDLLDSDGRTDLARRHWRQALEMVEPYQARAAAELRLRLERGAAAGAVDRPAAEG
ncbi:MAG TPA: BTAD domain-containing putative transcriptional regulator [Actinocrinis sp.]